MKLSEAIESCFQTRQSWNSGSGAGTVRININHALRILGDISVYEIKTKHFKIITTQLLEEKYSASVINQVTGALRTLLCELRDCGDELIVVPSFKRQTIKNSRPDFYSETEIQMLLNASAELDDYHLLHDSILFAYKTGCRQAEMLTLTDESIDWENEQITFFDTKNGEDHIIHLHSDLIAVLERRNHYRVDGRLFPWDGCRHGVDSLRREFKSLRDRLGIADKKLWHTIRHTTGTHLVSRGAQLRVIMGVLNHKNVKSTLRYAKAADTSKKEALELL